MFVALLRGINVGGNRTVEMKRLKTVFERAGFCAVRTYINSGNVIFRAEETDPDRLVAPIEAAIEGEFGFPVRVIVRSAQRIREIAEALPGHWANDAHSKCDVMFLGADVESPDVVSALTIKPDIDEVLYAGGAVLWRVDRSKVTRSGMFKLHGTELYAQITVRNCNTVRKLDELMR